MSKRTHGLGKVLYYWAEGYNITLRQVWAGTPGWFGLLVFMMIITPFMPILLLTSLIMGVPDGDDA